MTQCIVTRVPSGGSSSRPLYNIEEKDDKVGNDLGPKTLDSGLERFDSGLEKLDPGLERLAAGVKEDFSRLSSNDSGLDLAPSEQVLLFKWSLIKLLDFSHPGGGAEILASYLCQSQAWQKSAGWVKREENTSTKVQM